MRIQRVRWRGRDEIGAAVATGKAFGDYGGGGDEVGEAFGAAKVGGWYDGREEGRLVWW